jgi:hypothetical protein
MERTKTSKDESSKNEPQLATIVTKGDERLDDAR